MIVFSALSTPALAGILWLAIVLTGLVTWASIRTAGERRRQDRIPLAGPDDQDLDFAAALRPGPFPPYAEEREELEGLR